MSSRNELMNDMISRLVTIRDRFYTLNGLKRIEKEFVDSNVIASSSFKDYFDKNKLDEKRRIYSWLSVCYLIFMVIIVSRIVYKNETDLYLYFGLPFGIMKGQRELLTVLLLCYVFAASSRASFLISEAKHQLEFIKLFSFLESQLRGKLMARHLKKYSMIVEIVGNYLVIFCPLGETLVALFHLCFVAYTLWLKYVIVGEFNFSLVNLALRFIICWLAFNYALHLVSRLTFVTLSTYVLTVFYLRIRFEQVKNRILYSRSPRMLFSAIYEHNEICLILISNNQLMKYLVFFVYLIVTVILDLLLYLAIFSHDLSTLIRLIPVCFSLGSGVGLALQAYVSGNMTKCAHWPYARLNSIIAKHYYLDRKIKFHFIHLIERLADTKIAVWCLNLFQLDYFNFYMLVAFVAQNFFLIINLKTNFIKENQM